MPINKHNSESGFTHLLVLIAIITLVGGATTLANIKTIKEFPLAASQGENVLGENEIKENEKDQEEQEKQEENKQEEQKKGEEKKKEENKKVVEQAKEQSKSNNSGSSNPIKSKTETVSSSGIKSKTQTEGKKSETEIETPDGQKIKTKVEDDGSTKIEIEHGQLKLKYVLENGVVKLKAENESGQEVELDDDEVDELENEIEDNLEDEGIQIATGSGKPIFAKNNIAAITDFPLSIEVGTNQLIVSTPAGQKIVTVLPDQAVQNLLATNVINRIESQPTDPQTTGELGSLNGVVKLEIRNNEVTYKVKGIKTHNLLGFIPVNTATTAFVSAQSGNLIAQEQSLLANIIDLFAP